MTLRLIAEAAGVSTMAVSFALRGSPEVSEAQRNRIQRIADQLGYRPDPLLAHLMQYLRPQRRRKSAGNLAVLTTMRVPFVQRLLDGVTVRAERLGYHVDVVDAGSVPPRSPRLTRTLLARGVSGVLLAPAATPTNYRDLLDWSQFTAVGMTYSIVEPHVNRVVTHHFDNALRAFARLEQEGCGRIGLAMTPDMEFRANHSYTGAYFRRLGRGEVDCPPILYLDAANPDAIRDWFQRHSPDAVVVANAPHVKNMILPAIGARAARQTRFLCLDYEDGSGVSGIDQVFEVIGAHAVDTLVAQIHRNERGLPSNPVISMVEGRWIKAPAKTE